MMAVMSVTADILVIVPAVLGSTVIGAAINAVSQSAGARRAEQQAQRERARDLLSQIVNAAAALETEKAVFRDRRNSWRANSLAAGQALLDVVAAWVDGNWVRGASASARSLREWDAAEGARFMERVQAAAAQVNPALVSLSLLSPQLEVPCTRVADALAAAGGARGRKNTQSTSEALASAISELRAAVYTFTAPRPPSRWRLRRRRAVRSPDTPAIQ
jgi:hypothetical protein